MIVYFKPTYACNMGCEYCIVKNVDNIKPPNIEYSYALLESYPKGTHIIFHGGEPTLLPVNYYHNIVDKFKDKYTFSMQTNLMIKKIDEWIELFKKLEYISTSNDFINTLRLKGDYELWDNNLKKLLENNIEVQVIVTLTPANLNSVNKIKKFFEKYKDYTNLISIRINYVKPVGCNIKLNEGDYSKFLIQLHRELPQYARVENFNEIITFLKEGSSNNRCMFTSLCFNDYQMVDGEGNKYTCSGLEELKVKVPSVDRYIYLQENDCKGCKWWNLCQGGCVIDAISSYGTPYKKTFMCQDYKNIFEYFSQFLTISDMAHKSAVFDEFNPFILYPS